MARVALVEAFYGGSHRSWADTWVRHSAHQIDLITHPDESWRWRLRGGAVTLGEEFKTYVAEQGPPDAVVVSGMVDVASFAGIARRVLGAAPLAVYMHESQLLYPLGPNQRVDDTPALTNWRSMVAADAVWFNSGFHRDALHAALPDLLSAQQAPRHNHLIEGAFASAEVLWPGVDTRELIDASRTSATDSSPLVLWNQRWDHDKNPLVVFEELAALAEAGVAFSLALAGQNQRRNDSGFAQVRHRLGDRIVHDGFAQPDEYRELLLRSDVVVSAADHEFFGIALVEAMAAGAVPVLPDKLSFPELIEPNWHAHGLYAAGELQHRLRYVLTNLPQVRGELTGLRESMIRFDAAHSTASHDDAVTRLTAAVRTTP